MTDKNMIFNELKTMMILTDKYNYKVDGISDQYKLLTKILRLAVIISENEYINNKIIWCTTQGSGWAWNTNKKIKLDYQEIFDIFKQSSNLEEFKSNLGYNLFE